MVDVLLHAFSTVLVLVAVAGLGYWTSYRNWYDDKARSLIARLVNLAIPFFLFYSVVSKFSNGELLELLKNAYLPFVTIGINFLISLALSRTPLVRESRRGAFIAAFSGATVGFVGVPVITTMFGEVGMPYLLIYFFANVTFIWTVGLYNVQLDGVRRSGGTKPSLISKKSFKMLFSGPLVGFLLGVAVVLFMIAVPRPVYLSVKMIGQLATPLALIFIGITIHRVGFAALKKMPCEVWLVLLSCFVLRPIVMYLCSLPLEMSTLMRQVFIISAALPVSPVIAVLSKHYGADDAFASEAVGLSVVGLFFALPVLLVAVSFVS